MSKNEKYGTVTADYSYEEYNIKKGIVYGAIAGLISAIGFTGFILWMPSFYGFPTGTFLHALGLSLKSPLSDPISIGFAAFLIIIIQGIAVGIVFGIVTSKVKKLHISNKKNGVAIGIATGIIAFLVLYVPMIFTIYQNLLSEALASFSSTELSLKGHSGYALSMPSQYDYLIGTLLWGFVSYVAYGFFLGGIMTWAYSVWRFDMKNK